MDLTIDPSLRVWVLFPIFFVMILVGVLRHYATILLNPSPKNGDLVTIRQQQFLMYGSNLRLNGVNLTPAAFQKRQSYFVEQFKSTKYLADPENDGKTNPSAMLNDPSQFEKIMDSMKGQAMMVIPQTLMMGWVNSFFAGFILMKLPFPLTIRFKSMLQSGVNTQDLDVRWVSSLSWYFLNLMGLNSIYSLILGGQNSAGGVQAMGVNTGAAGAMQPGIVYANVYKGEAENLALANPKSVLNGVEDRIIKQFS